MKNSLLGTWYILTKQSKFCVRYKDGSLSKLMIYQRAEARAYMDDGEVMLMLNDKDIVSSGIKNKYE